MIAVPPHAVAKNDRRGSVAGILVLEEQASHQRPRVHLGKHARRDERTLIPFRTLLRVREVDATVEKCRQVFERGLLFPPSDVVVDRHTSRRDTVRDEGFRYTHEAVAVFEGQPANQHSIKPAKILRDGPDPERDGNDRHQREARRFVQHAKTVAKVFQELVHRPWLTEPHRTCLATRAHRRVRITGPDLAGDCPLAAPQEDGQICKEGRGTGALAERMACSNPAHNYGRRPCDPTQPHPARG